MEETLYQKREGKKLAEPTKPQPKPVFKKWAQPNPKPSTSQAMFMPRTMPGFVPCTNNNMDNQMEVDQAWCPPMKCYACRKLGHMARNCRSSRQVWQLASVDRMNDSKPQGCIEEVTDQEDKVCHGGRVLIVICRMHDYGVMKYILVVLLLGQMGQMPHLSN